jgi:hypothetical protein
MDDARYHPISTGSNRAFIVPLPARNENFLDCIKNKASYIHGNATWMDRRTAGRGIYPPQMGGRQTHTLYFQVVIYHAPKWQRCTHRRPTVGQYGMSFIKTCNHYKYFTNKAKMAQLHPAITAEPRPGAPLTGWN